MFLESWRSLRKYNVSLRNLLSFYMRDDYGLGWNLRGRDGRLKALKRDCTSCRPSHDYRVTSVFGTTMETFDRHR
jgi:hypothetical protein